MDTASRYPSFEYSAEQLHKFLAASEFFTIMLTNGDIVHFTPEDEGHFRQWLSDNHITDIRSESDWVVTKKQV